MRHTHTPGNIGLSCNEVSIRQLSCINMAFTVIARDSLANVYPEYIQGAAEIETTQRPRGTHSLTPVLCVHAWACA